MKNRKLISLSRKAKKFGFSIVPRFKNPDEEFIHHMKEAQRVALSHYGIKDIHNQSKGLELLTCIYLGLKKSPETKGPDAFETYDLCEPIEIKNTSTGEPKIAFNFLSKTNAKNLSSLRDYLENSKIHKTTVHRFDPETLEPIEISTLSKQKTVELLYEKLKSNKRYDQ